MTLNQELLTEIIPVLAKKIAQHHEEVGDFDQTNYGTWFERNRASIGRLKDFFSERYDARFTQKPPHDHTVTMAGVRATSTSGWLVALQNWKRAAEKKLSAVADQVHPDGFNPHGSGPVPIEPRER